MAGQPGSVTDRVVSQCPFSLEGMERKASSDVPCDRTPLRDSFTFSKKLGEAVEAVEAGAQVPVRYLFAAGRRRRRVVPGNW